MTSHTNQHAHPTIRAAEYDRYGAPDVLRVTDAPRPSPGAREVLVKVRASSINGGELAKRQGRLRLVTGRRFPQPTGVDFVGTVVEFGDGTTGPAPGTMVWGTVGERAGVGTQAEYVVVPTNRISAAPRNLDPVDAVTLLAGGTTALAALRDRVRLRSGERLLVRGAAGGVGSVAVQVGAMLGADVTGLANPASARFVHEVGAKDVIDYRTPASKLGSYDVIFDTRGSDLRQYRSLLRPGGRMVTIAPDLDNLLRGLAYLGWSLVHGLSRVRLFLGSPDTVLLEDVANAAETGRLRPVRAESFPLERIADAHRALEHGGIQGKVVIDLSWSVPRI